MNILFFDIFLDPSGLPLGIVIAACEVFLIHMRVQKMNPRDALRLLSCMTTLIAER